MTSLPILFAPGDRVRVVSGQLAGTVATVCGTDELPAELRRIPVDYVPIRLDPGARDHYAAIAVDRLDVLPAAAPTVAAAFDRAAEAITGKSAGELNQALASEVERHPDDDLDTRVVDVDLGGEGGCS